ncbi:hypothetical protein [Hymenobacter crusticola]|uniref:hypothetical protein n=1 Tax=Hymenobacter crusticola TaxID=1770526 RepID=UPI00117BA35C|nr:hypothetical protein [Hymenobacter crusticola]
MNRIVILIFLVFAIGSNSGCDRLRNRKHRLTQRVRQFVFNKKDRIFPGFDATQADTESNRRRFRDFLGITPTPDVKNIYCASDRLGIDASFTFTFECSPSTHQAIIQQLQLQPDTAIVAFSSGGFSTNYAWWDKKLTEQVKPYSRSQGALRWYLWRDEKRNKDYFLTFDF